MFCFIQQLLAKGKRANYITYNQGCDNGNLSGFHGYRALLYQWLTADYQKIIRNFRTVESQEIFDKPLQKTSIIIPTFCFLLPIWFFKAEYSPPEHRGRSKYRAVTCRSSSKQPS